MARINCLAAFWCLAILIVSPLSDGKKVLLLPYAFHSHVRQLYTIGKTLANEGHEVYMGLADSLPQREMYMTSKVKLLIYDSKDKDFFGLGLKGMSDYIMEMKEDADSVETFRRQQDFLLHMCTNSLGDEKYFKTLSEMKFDLAIVDVFPISRCLLILPYSLDIPYVGLTAVYEPWLTRTPAFPSVIPNNLLGKVYTDHMTFFERLGNLWQNIDWIAFTGVNFLSDDNFKRYIRNKPIVSLNQMAAKCMLVLIDVDPIMDYPRPTMPHEINIGGLSTKPAQPLPEDLKEYLDLSPEGVILATFGSGTFKLEPETYIEFKKAFAQIKHKILWKYIVDEATDLPNNVKVLDWLPQNDVLGHPNIKLFITHCGNGGQMEALYHGVPMIGFPFFGDQPFNCKRMEAHGFGIYLKTQGFKAQHLVKAAATILSNQSYHENIKHASAAYRDSYFRPLERANYWINHVMKFGGQHLHSHALDMPWYEFLMLDIAAFILTIMFAAVLVFACLLKIAFNNLTKPHAKAD